MFADASASLRSLLVFLPLVRGGDDTGQLSVLESPADLEEEPSFLDAGDSAGGDVS